MKRIIIYILPFLLLASACSFTNKQGPKPNVILVLTDDQGWGDVGFNGNKIINTPTLDKLASESVVINRFYVSPVCAPTRASLLTGKDHLSTGVSWVTHRKEVMRESEITMGEIFSEYGYNTAYFGKWHNGAQYPHTPNGQGFETFFGFCGGHINNYFDTELSWNRSTVKTKGYITDVITDSLVSFISKQKQPYLAYVAYNTPHTPYQVDDKYFDKYKEKGLDDKTASIYGMCENIDDNVQRIMHTLKANNQFDNTILIYMSDNGPNYIRYNGGLKGRKAQVDEGGVRVPFIISYPNGGFKNRTIFQSFAAHIDVLPTLMGLVGLPQNSYKFDGKDIKQLLFSEEYELESRSFYNHHVIRKFDVIPGAVRRDYYLLTLNPWDTSLYNLKVDPFQREDISDKHENTVQILANQYDDWFNNVTSTGIEPAPIEIGYSSVTKIVLPAHEASLFGNVAFAGCDGWANDWLINFNNSADSALWKVKVIEEGVYDVSIKYACHKTDIGNAIELHARNQKVVKEIKNYVTANQIPNNDRVKRGEVEERDWGVLHLGEITINKTDRSLKVGVTYKGKSNIQIKELILNRIQ